MPYVKKLIPLRQKKSQLARKNSTRSSYTNKSRKQRIPQLLTMKSGTMQIAPRYFTKMNLGFQGITPAGAPATGYGRVTMNVLYEPFSYSSSIASMPINGTDGSSITTQYNGYTALTNLYSLYRIHGSRLKITATTSSSLDTSNIYAFPYNEAANGTFNSSGQLYHRAAGFKGYKSIMTGPNNPAPSMELYAKCRDVLGYTKAQYDCQPAVPVAIAPPTSLLCDWQIAYATIDGAAITGQIYWKIELECYVEFSGPEQLSD